MQDPAREPVAWPRVYRPTRFTRAVLGLGGALMMAMGVVALASLVLEPASELLVAVMAPTAVGLAAFGALGIASARHDRVVLHQDAIEVWSVLYDPRRVRKSAIVGVRAGPQPGIIFLELVNGRRLVLSLQMERDEELDAWLRSLRDLTSEDAQRALDEIVRDPAHGPTEDDARRRLASARTLAKRATLASIGIALWGCFYPRPYELAIGALALLPPLVLVVLATGRGLYSITGERTEVRADLAVCLLMPSFGLALRALSAHVLDHLPLVGYGVAVTLALAVVLALIVPRRDRRHALPFAVLLLAYGWGLAVHVNVLLDSSEPERARVEVVDRWISSGRGGGPDLRLAGSEVTEPDTTVRVSRALYDAVEVGGSVCVARHEGALGARWLSVGQCP